MSDVLSREEAAFDKYPEPRCRSCEALRKQVGELEDAWLDARGERDAYIKTCDETCVERDALRKRVEELEAAEGTRAEWGEQQLLERIKELEAEEHPDEAGRQAHNDVIAESLRREQTNE